jgi:alpha-tubulin suppressor-like RCC1 family protein
MIVIPSFRGLVARVFTEESGPESGSLYSWGFNDKNNTPPSGQLGIGNNDNNRSSPVLINSSTGFSGSVSGWTKVSSGWRHSLGINSGKLYSWGSNIYGQLGLLNHGSDTNRSSPVQVGSGSNWKYVSSGAHHSLAIKADGTLWAWGYNYFGQLGVGDNVNRSSPTQIDGSSWSKISAGFYHSLAIKTDGSLWAWGKNDNGQLGDNSTSNKNSPVVVQSGTSWIAVSAGGVPFNGASHSLGIRSNNTLWSWGSNNFYQLGLGNFNNYSSPMPVGSDADWSSVSAGGEHSFAIKNTGSLWAWGRNDSGQLGRGSTSNDDTSKPMQVGSSNWKFASAGYRHSGAINSSDKMFFWGETNFGQVGDSQSTTDRSSSFAVLSSSDWLYIASMKDNSSFAIKKP